MKRAASVLLLAAMVLGLMLPAMAAEGAINETDVPVAPEPGLNAYSAILLDMDTEEVLYEYNADEKNYPASCTKIMTALLCLENGDPDDMVTVSATAINAVPATASKGGIVIGEEMTIHQVLQLMLVVSASEATTVIAEYVAGDIESFVDMMNKRAAELGCTGTHFANTHGYPDPEHYTTARDLSKIALEAMKYKEFRDIVGAAVTTVEPTNVHGTQVITSTNGILPGSAYPDYNYPYAIGIKTGHTDYAGYCLASAADKDGLRLLCVVMGTPSRTSSFAQTITLFDWGYENYDIIFYGDGEIEDPDLPDMTNTEEDPEVQEEPVIEVLEETVPSSTPQLTSPPAQTPEPTPAPSARAQSPLVARYNAMSPAAAHRVLGTAAALLASVMLLIVLAVVGFHRKK